ncbi:MAG: SpoIIE family protein phosphatase [Leptospiraceae bacterium]|nr:SpoIIE family protein phosphatase [Leptospiraceae bacterium]
MKILNNLNNLTIRQKLRLMAASALAAITFGIVLTIVLIFSAKNRSDRALLTSAKITKTVDLTRSAQVNFKKQVQEWKNTLLRGNDKNLFEKYWASFQDHEKKTLEDLNAVKEMFSHFQLDTAPVDSAIEEEKKLGEQYRAAIAQYRSNDLNSAFRIDRTVRGIDRKPTDDIENLVHIMEKEQQKLIAALRSETSTSLTLSLFLGSGGGVLAALAIFLLFVKTIRTITSPLDRTIEIFQKISSGYLQNEIDTDKRDEIGEMWRALDSMQLSLREKTEALHAMNANLENSLKEVQILKEEQDGDYFLTSLLLAPLGANNIRHPRLNVEFFTRQKKKFKFRKWSREIGGDISIAHELKLNNTEYCVILNGDAMGKSIQGAGGAIVLGSVFAAILERTRISSIYSEISPERWLKNTVLELNKVFASFDGSMLLSLVITLIDAEHGLCYYVNAEHPAPILYRDGVAGFVNADHYFHKLGTPGIDSEIFIDTFQLEKGDVLFLGSDGRDDLQIADRESGSRVINENERLILDCVNRAGGDMALLISEIEEQGELTDDLSLVKIEYAGKAEDAELDKHIITALSDFYEFKHRPAEERERYLIPVVRSSPENSEILRALTHHYYAMKDYMSACGSAIKYCEQKPEDVDFLYVASYLGKLAGNYDIAIEYGERLRLRKPKLTRNLMNLADAHAMKRNYERALELIAEVEKIEPTNSKIERLQTAIQKRVKEASQKPLPEDQEVDQLKQIYSTKTLLKRR